LSLAASVVICTYNPRPHYLRRVLAALREQTLPLNQWELVVIDNASDLSVAAEYELSWHPQSRHVQEPLQGIAHARLRGIREAAAELVVFVDDDNVLAPDYLEAGLRIGREWPQLGVWGGCILPEFEIEPPEHLRRYLRLLSWVDVDAPRWSNIETCHATEVATAGMFLRETVGAKYQSFYESSELRLPGHLGTTLTGGEDIEICRLSCRSGFGLGIFPDLKLTHLIPRERLTEAYLLRISEGYQFSSFILNYKWWGEMPRSQVDLVEVLRLIKNALVRRGIERRMVWARSRAAIRARRLIAHTTAGRV
jgi:glycosyltransferase involved in cell wall biosynthesis